MTKKYQLKNLDDTKQLAHAISNIANKNIYLLLSGELASGKTQLTKFLGSLLGVTTIINSPSFVILNIYDTSHNWKLVHIDAYRLNKHSDFSEYFEQTINNFTVIEWPEKIKWNFNKEKTIKIDFKVENETREAIVTTNNLSSKEEQLLFTEKKAD